MMKKPNKVFYVKCTGDSFYRAWIEFLTPYHKLTAREKDVAARLLLQYDKFKENVPDPEVLKDLMWSRKSRKDIMDSLHMSQAHFQMVLAKLKQAGVIVDGDIDQRYIPPKFSDEPRFMLQVIFDWSSPKNPINRAAE